MYSLSCVNSCLHVCVSFMLLLLYGCEAGSWLIGDRDMFSECVNDVWGVVGVA